MDVLRDRTLLRTRRLRRGPSRAAGSTARICSAATATCSSSRGASLRSSRIAALRTSSRIFFESSVVIFGTSSTKQPVDELARVLERRQRLLLGPVVQAADPEVVVLVEVPLLALREEVAAAREAVLERGERLVPVDLDAAGFALDLVLEPVQVGRALLDVDRGDDRRGEVQDLLELARGDVEQVADAARHALEEPDVRDRRGEVDVTHALAAHLLPRHLDAAALADDALVADALVLAAVALPVARRPEDALAEEAVALGLERAVVDRLRLRDLTRRPVADLLARGEPDPDRVEIIDVDQVLPQSLISLRVQGQRGLRRRAARLRPRPLPSPLPLRRPRRRRGRRATRRPAGRARRRLVDALLALLGLLGRRLAADRAERAGREVDAELLGGAQELVLLLAHLDLAALVGEHVHVERERLHLLQQHLEGLGDRRLGDVLALDDRLVGLHAPDRVVGLDGEHLLQRVRGAVRLERPHLHLAEALAAELRLAAQRLLGDERVRARAPRVDLVVHEVEQLQDVHVADGDLLLERLTGAAVEELHLARALAPLRAASCRRAS